jgi:hypothetical protein
MPEMSEMRDRRATRAESATAGRYWLPTRPYSLVDAVNRCAAATGRVRYAQQAADAGYNGHSVTVAYNNSRNYCMETALRAGRYEYDLGHRGTRVTTCDLTPGEAQVGLALGYVPWSPEGEEAWNALWYTELHDCVGEALRCDTVHLLLCSQGPRVCGSSFRYWQVAGVSYRGVCRGARNGAQRRSWRRRGALGDGPRKR